MNEKHFFCNFPMLFLRKKKREGKFIFKRINLRSNAVNYALYKNYGCVKLRLPQPRSSSYG
uniref:Uncharacterized protein n=1 Tax=Rhizophagus irregularis (strain DAOM 181602 / DAOM 197198 / MUCL 43194) TaxID=747089 RepID=U9TMM0_RHIID